MARVGKNSVAVAGEFAVLSQLAIRGYNAGMTLDNTKNIDIFIFDPMTKKAYQVDVETNHERRNGPTDSKLFGKFVTSWQMHEKQERIKDPDLSYCFVQITTSRTDPP